MVLGGGGGGEGGGVEVKVRRYYHVYMIWFQEDGDD